MKHLSSRLSEARAMKAEEQSRVLKIIQTNKGMEVENEKLKGKIDNICSENLELIEKSKDVEDQKKVTYSKILCIQDENNKIQEQLKSIADQVCVKEERNKVMQEVNDKLKAENEQLEKETSEMEVKLKEKVSEHETIKNKSENKCKELEKIRCDLERQIEKLKIEHADISENYETVARQQAEVKKSTLQVLSEKDEILGEHQRQVDEMIKCYKEQAEEKNEQENRIKPLQCVLQEEQVKSDELQRDVECALRDKKQVLMQVKEHFENDLKEHDLIWEGLEKVTSRITRASDNTNTGCARQANRRY